MPVIVRPLLEQDLPAADLINRLAFGTFLGLPEPGAFQGDADYIRTRWRADPSAAFGAELEGELVGSNFATIWGSFGFFGPLSVHPDKWGQGIAQRLMEPIMECFSKRGTTHAGLFTFAESPKHISLYQKFGFWPRFLTMLMSKAVARTATAAKWTKFSDFPSNERDAVLGDCRKLTDGIYDGLDVTAEIRAVDTQMLGDTLLLWDKGELAGLAICHCGAGTEAGSGTCYVKFGAAANGPAVVQNFDRLLEVCESFAAEKGLEHLEAGVNSARHEAYLCLLARSFRIDFQGVAMEQHNVSGYNRPGVYLMDDWR